MFPLLMTLAAASPGQVPMPGPMPPAVMPGAPMAPVVQMTPTTPPPAAYTPAPAATPAPCATCAEAPAEKPADEPWALMRTLKGTTLGAQMEERRLSVSGWVEGSYNTSSASVNNAPVVWNDRANRFLLNQLWVRAERSVDTEADHATWGFRADFLYGTDYRFTLPRGLFNSQLQNAQGNQNLYGVDPIQHYVNVYLPNLFQGTDIRVGRLFTPFGYESLEGVSTPFVSRSYAFNFCPPFTHFGIQVSPTFNDNWSGKFMLANGNDVYIGDPAEELRFVGAVTYTSDSKKDVITAGTSVGRGKFNAGDRFAPATAALANEPAGRNNINVFDLVWTHQLTDKFSYATEGIFGYQSNVPSNVPGGNTNNRKVSGSARWGSFVQYFNYAFNDKLTGITRVELFDDATGQRTGFEGLYTAVTIGAQYKPTKAIMIRPEVRYDHNNYTRPFEGDCDIFTASLDFVVRF